MTEETQIIDNMELNRKENYVIISVNPKIYSLPIVYSAAYVFLDKAYVILDGDPKEEILVKLRPKKGQDLETLGREFNNELLNYAFYAVQSERTKSIRNAIVQRALLTHAQSEESNQPEFIEDPENIAKPWKEKNESN